MSRTRGQSAYKIGITGGVASGKTLVGKALEKYGVSVLDTNETIMNLLMTHPQVIQKLTDRFGKDILDSHGRLAQKKLEQYITTSSEHKDLFYSIIHPYVREEIKRFLYSPIGNLIRAVQSTLLFEMKTEHLYDEVWIIGVDPHTQRERLMKRDSLTEAEAEHYIEIYQMPESSTEVHQRVIDNSSDPFKTEQATLEALTEVKRKFVRSNASF